MRQNRALRVVRFVGGPLDGRSLELPDSETVYHMLDAHGEGERGADLPVMGTYYRTGDEMRWSEHGVLPDHTSKVPNP